jgi:hypothetical protein
MHVHVSTEATGVSSDRYRTACRGSAAAPGFYILLLIRICRRAQ